MMKASSGVEAAQMRRIAELKRELWEERQRNNLLREELAEKRQADPGVAPPHVT